MDDEEFTLEELLPYVPEIPTVPDPDVHPVPVEGQGQTGMMFGPIADLENLFSDLTEAIESADIDGTNKKLNKDESAIHLEFFTVAHAIIENRSSYLLRFHLIDIDKINDEAVKELFSRLPQRRRRAIIEKVDLELITPDEVDVEDLTKNMKRTEDVRNRLVHNPFKRRFIQSPDKLIKDAEKAMDAVQILDGIVQRLMDDIKAEFVDGFEVF